MLEPEETTSFSFATLIGVFIVVLVIGVAVYVGVSRREQVRGEKMVLIVWGVGRRSGGGGILTPPPPGNLHRQSQGV